MSWESFQMGIFVWLWIFKGGSWSEGIRVKGQPETPSNTLKFYDLTWMVP